MTASAHCISWDKLSWRMWLELQVGWGLPTASLDLDLWVHLCTFIPISWFQAWSSQRRRVWWVLPFTHGGFIRSQKYSLMNVNLNLCPRCFSLPGAWYTCAEETWNFSSSSLCYWGRMCTFLLYNPLYVKIIILLNLRITSRAGTL